MRGVDKSVFNAADADLAEKGKHAVQQSAEPVQKAPEPVRVGVLLPLRGDAVGELRLQAVDAALFLLAELRAAPEGLFELLAHVGEGLGLGGPGTHGHAKEEKREDTDHGSRFEAAAKITNNST